MTIGERIRQRRKEMGRSLRSLATEIGVTASFLSLVERDLASPSIGTLWKIARAMDISIFRLLADPERQSRVVRSDERRRITMPKTQLSYELLTPDLNRKMEMVLVELEPGESAIAATLSEPTEECVFVLQGKLEIVLVDETTVLAPGDSIYFEGVTLQELRSVGDEKLVWVSAITPAVF